MGKFLKGHKKKGGRQKGGTNKLTTTVKEAVLLAFQELQKDKEANLLSWGRENPNLFYPIAAKLIPTEINANISKVGKELADESKFE